MTFISPASTITSRFATQWAASAYAAVETEIDNEAFDPPTPDVNNILATSWVRQAIRPASTIGITFSGSTQDWTTGTAVYQIFTPLGAGLGDAAAMAEVIRGFFNRQVDGFLSDQRHGALAILRLGGSMGYIKVKEMGRVYAMEPGDRLLRGGGVLRPDGTIVAGDCADPVRAAQWEADGLLESPPKKKAAAKKTAVKKKAGR
ncbi:MAG: hypothetical protein ACYSUI_25595 [Planctomycetota bacterium]|jgi:hypothetical protein